MRPGQIVSGVLAGKMCSRLGVTAGGEQAVTERLRVQIAELLRCQLRQQHRLNRLLLTVQRTVGRLLRQRPLNQPTQQPRPRRQPQRQFAGRGDERGGGGEKVGEQFGNRFDGGGSPFQRVNHPGATRHPSLRRRGMETLCQSRRQPSFPAHIPAKFQIVGQQQIGEAGPITLQLLAGFHRIEIGPNILGLDVAQRQLAARNDVIRRTAGDPLRLVGGGHRGVQRLDQRLQSRAMGVLGGVARFQRGG